ncbi:hypothetical protein [Pseudomonas sp. BN411]|uniref:hypothetical protein n=1 Tax=Pseudomonas sp. BN411 TaxID=2567887 RepID=UPI002454A837|nr:hypothetical protein [Pseudomonas sp. BN411]MDH4560459.1 hypothetical protein [Pseudomonas sp. BN411]
MTRGLPPKTIIELLLTTAPKSALEELELDNSTKDDWVSCLESEGHTQRGQHEIVDLSSLAIYYATRSLSAVKKVAHWSPLALDFWTLYHFAQTTKAEDFFRTEDLLREAGRQRKQVHIAKARQAKAAAEAPSRTEKWIRVERLEAELLASGKSERDLSSIIEKRLGIPKKTYRDWRRKRKTAGL